MDKTNVYHVGMEGGRIQMCSEPGPGPPGQLPTDEAMSKNFEPPRNPQMKFQSSQMAWRMKAVNMPQSHGTDYSDVDVSISGAKLKSENLRLKNIPEPQADQSVDYEKDLDINIKLATKKVVLPAETKDEAIPGTSGTFQHNRRSLKRTIAQVVYEPSASHALDPDTLKMTEDVLQKIKEEPDANLEICLNYNRQLFSGFRNLKTVDDIKVSSGTFGDVIKVKDSQTGNILIQKQIKRNAQGKFDIEKYEIEVPLQFADVENIAKFLGLYWRRDLLLFIMEDAGISLRQLLLVKERDLLLEPGRIEKIMLDVFTPLSHLALHHVTHCDIKPENICINTKIWVSKVVDFGSCKTPQNAVNYRGTTPEYLDPLANKFHYECYKNKVPPKHRLNDKDDVFGAGLVGLYLIIGGHPMIRFFAGCDIVTDLQGRLEIMKKISEMTEEQMSQLLNVPMSVVMRGLLQGVLALDRAKRWTSKEAVCYLLTGNPCSDVQPPNKLCRHEPHPSSSQAEDLPIDLRRKDSGKAVPQRVSKLETPGSPEMIQNQGLGFVMKRPAATTQTGGILLPTKFANQQWMMSPLVNPQAQQQQQQKVLPAGPEATPNDQESQEYKDLVMSFNVKTQVGKGAVLPVPQAGFLANVQQRDLQKFSMLPFSTGNPQRMLLPNQRVYQPTPAHIGPVREGRVAAGPLFGLSGIQLSEVAERFTPGVPGNIPNMDELMPLPSGEETYRPKLKGRRGRGSQDGK